MSALPAALHQYGVAPPGLYSIVRTQFRVPPGWKIVVLLMSACRK